MIDERRLYVGTPDEVAEQFAYTRELFGEAEPSIQVNSATSPRPTAAAPSSCSRRTCFPASPTRLRRPPPDRASRAGELRGGRLRPGRDSRRGTRRGTSRLRRVALLDAPIEQ